MLNQRNASRREIARSALSGIRGRVWEAGSPLSSRVKQRRAGQVGDIEMAAADKSSGFRPAPGIPPPQFPAKTDQENEPIGARAKTDGVRPEWRLDKA
jgi:hypothetical protein